jgi:hypothetical protein
MPNPTPELGLQKAVDSDDTADYLEISLGTSLTTVDSLFNNTTGHTHGGVHQGGPIGSIPITAIPDGSITSAKLTDGTIATVDLADSAVTTAKIAVQAVSQVVDTFANPPGAASTTSATLSTIPGLDVAITTTGGDVVVFATISWIISAAPATASWGVSVDGGADTVNFPISASASNGPLATFVRRLGPLAAGAHTIHMRWAITGGITLSLSGASQEIIVIEHKR